MKARKILAIETSCDDCSCAILSNDKILANVVISQKIHEVHGGVIPNIAADEHSNELLDVVKDALCKSNISLHEIDYFAATCGPGLISSLIVGSTFAKTLAIMARKPFIAVNHLVGHALAPRIMKDNVAYPYEESGYAQNTKECDVFCNKFVADDIIIKPAFPYLLLLLSGGHSELIIVHSPMKYTELGATLDDAVGETFDKVAKMLDLPYPGGPFIEKYAQNGQTDAFNFPRPIINSKDCNMSFSGLKTSVRMQIQEIKGIYEDLIEDDSMKLLEKDFPEHIPHICASFQQAVADVLIQKTKNGIENFINIVGSKPKNIVISGGVSSNSFIYSAIKNEIGEKLNIRISRPIKHLCTDNAGMIAWAAKEMLDVNYSFNDLEFEPTPRWSLENLCN